MNQGKQELAEKDLQDFLYVTPDLLSIVDTNGNFLKTNRAWEETLGYSTEELHSQTIFHYIHPEDLEPTLSAIKNLEEGLEITNFVNRYRTKTGHYLFIEWRARTKGNLIYSAARDITEQKNVEKKLRENQTLMDFFFSQSLTGFFFMMLDEPLEWNDSVDKEKALDYAMSHHRITKINQAMLDQYGATEQEFIGLVPNDLFAHDLEHGRKTWKRFFDEGKLHTETREQKIDGTLIDILGDYTLLYDEKGRILGHFGVQTDITDIKKAQKSLEESKRIAEEASRAKSIFLANMSHEIRTPLNGVIGFTDLLKNTDLDPMQKQYAENANTSGHALLGIINDILDFSKIEAGMMELDIRKTDILEILENSLDVIKYQAGKKNVEILLDVDPKCPRWVDLDSIRLKQVLFNLLSNAVKFTPQGEVRLSMSYTPISPKKGKFRFQVEDTGIGIGQEEQKKIFQVFAQADNSTTRKYGGTGLGLVISDMIVRKMGGEIKIDSEKGKGSKFCFELEASYHSDELLYPASGLGIQTCLIVDDNESNALILDHIFQNWGVKTQVCHSAKSGLGFLASQGSFDLVVTDYYMPEMDGLEFIRNIREDLKMNSQEQPILFLHSSSDDSMIYNRCKELDVNIRLTKPVKINDLFQFIRDLQISEFSWAKKMQTVEALPKEKLHQSSESHQPSQDPKPAIPPPEAPKKILVAEDNEMNMFLIRSLLKKLFPLVDILEAQNGQKALDFFQNEKPDVILMDVQMPVMDGIATTREIRKREENKGSHIPIIALTAGALIEEETRCLEAGMDSFLTKPIDRNKLEDTIHKTIFSV